MMKLEEGCWADWRRHSNVLLRRLINLAVGDRRNSIEDAVCVEQILRGSNASFWMYSSTVR